MKLYSPKEYGRLYNFSSVRITHILKNKRTAAIASVLL